MEKKFRKHYKKPKITEVKLVIEEAVLQACKLTALSPAKSGKTCSQNPCRTTLGS